MKPFDNEFLDKCKIITEGYDKACGSWSLDSQLLHIITEVAEVKDVIRNKKEKYGTVNAHYFKMLDEIADVFLTTLSLTNLLKISNDDLNTAIITKLAIVENRLSNLTIPTRRKNHEVS